jgi:hypothetical protein
MIVFFMDYNLETTYSDHFCLQFYNQFSVILNKFSAEATGL